MFPTVAAMHDQGRQRYAHELVYGAMGSPIQHELERVVAVVEGGTHTQIVSSGLAACTLPLLAFLNAGDHVLIPDSVYGPTRRFADLFLSRMGITCTYYPPLIEKHHLEGLLRETTRVVFTESPGSHSFEIQDISMVARVAKARGALLMNDNTWGLGVFRPFEHGVDVSIQALTKYASGHSDAVVGAVTVADNSLWTRLRDAAIQIGQVAGPDACWLTLRGLRTMGVRLERQAQSALTVALWLRDQPLVARVLHPALEECPGHVFWQRDFSGASSLFGLEFRREISLSAMKAFIDSLRLFSIGASWGGYESLVMPTTGSVTRVISDAYPEGPSLRLHVGLEDPQDLIADLAQGWQHLSEQKD